jgi:hypothetical protein
MFLAMLCGGILPGASIANRCAMRLGNFARTAGFGVSLVGAGTSQRASCSAISCAPSISVPVMLASWKPCRRRSWTSKLAPIFE